MSIAVGGDLFPFLRNTGASLDRERFPTAVFRGTPISLPVAAIDYTPVGPACLEPKA